MGLRWQNIPSDGEITSRANSALCFSDNSLDAYIEKHFFAYYIETQKWDRMSVCFTEGKNFLSANCPAKFYKLRLLYLVIEEKKYRDTEKKTAGIFLPGQQSMFDKRPPTLFNRDWFQYFRKEKKLFL